MISVRVIVGDKAWRVVQGRHLPSQSMLSEPIYDTGGCPRSVPWASDKDEPTRKSIKSDRESAGAARAASRHRTCAKFFMQSSVKKIAIFFRPVLTPGPRDAPRTGTGMDFFLGFFRFFGRQCTSQRTYGRGKNCAVEFPAALYK